MRKGVIQATLKGRQWRHGAVLWPFTVAGLIGRRQSGSTAPCFVAKRRRRTAAARTANKRQATGLDSSAPATRSRASHGSGKDTDASFVTNSDADSEADRDPPRHDESGTDDTLSGGEERAEDAPVPDVSDTTGAYQSLFGSRPMHEAVLLVVCRAAVLMNKLCGDNESEGLHHTTEKAMALQNEAYQFVCHYVEVLFGPVHTTKMHALAFHLVDELLNRRNLIEADTSVNEALHRLSKIMFANTNKQTTSFPVQRLRCEQTLARIIADDADDKMRAAAGLPIISRSAGGRAGIFDSVGDGVPEEGAPGVGPPVTNNPLQGDTAGEAQAEVEDADDEATNAEFGGAAAAGGGRGGRLRRRRRRVRISGRRLRVGDAVAADEGRLQGLQELLGVGAEQYLIVGISLKFEAELEWRPNRRLDQFVRAAPNFYRKPWFDHVIFRDANFPGKPQCGLARLLVRAVDGVRRDIVIIQRLVYATPRDNCVLTLFGCKRFKWDLDEETGFPKLAAVALVDVQRLEHVVPDFEELCERHGLLGTPATIPDTPHERRRQRYFSNIFFPWTSNSIDDTP